MVGGVGYGDWAAIMHIRMVVNSAVASTRGFGMDSRRVSNSPSQGFVGVSQLANSTKRNSTRHGGLRAQIAAAIRQSPTRLRDPRARVV